MTPEQVETLKKMAEENMHAWKETFEVLSDAMELSKDRLRDIREPLETFNSKTNGLRSFLLTLNRAAELEGHAGSRGSAGATRRTLHKKATGMIV